MAARRRIEDRLPSPPLRFAPLGEIRIYWVYEHELEILARGSTNALFLNFALFMLPISITLIVTMLTTMISSDRLFAGFLCVSVITAIAGIFLLLLWWRSYKSSGELLRTIQSRMPPAQQTSLEAESSRETGPPHSNEGIPPTTS